jgi:hypothetical protein
VRPRGAPPYAFGVSPDGVRAAFQLDRFEQTGEDRLEVAGRWYGVRGLRFVRPALTVQTPDGERNLLALLEHKPWAAEEGESWIAAFPWKGESLDPGQAELAVAPSVVVALAPGSDGAERGGALRGKRSVHQRLEDSEVRARRLDSEVAWLREEREALVADKRAAEEDAGRLRAELAEAQAAISAAGEERVAARSEREAAAKELKAAAEERDRALSTSKRAQAERDEAQSERESAAAGRDQALLDLQTTVREREEARSERDALLAERDEAVAARQRAYAERDAALGRGSGFPAMSAADLERQPHSPAAAGRPQRRPPRMPHLPDVDWAARVIALGALIVLLIVVIVLLKVL